MKKQKLLDKFYCIFFYFLTTSEIIYPITALDYYLEILLYRLLCALIILILFELINVHI